MYRFEDKVAFITGGLGVIGNVYIKALIKNNIKGVAIIDLKDEAKAQQEIQSRYNSVDIIYIKTDISKKHELKNAFDKTIQHFGQLDIVINNAGVLKEEDYELCLKINFMAVANGTIMALQDYLPKYKKSSGVIVNTASVGGVIPLQAPVYSLSKHAAIAIGLCYEHNEDCKKHDIRVLTICPSAIPSPLTQEVPIFAADTTNNTRYLKYSKNGEYLGDGLINIIKEGQNGAVWLFKDGEPAYKMDYQPIVKPAMDYVLD